MMKIPKELKIFGYDWKVVLGDKEGGSYSWHNLTIILPENPNWRDETLIHEILEMTMAHLGYRFTGNEGGMEYQFHFDHTGLTRIHQEVYQILKDNKLI